MSGIKKLVRRVAVLCATVVVVPVLGAAPAAQANEALYVPWTTSLPGWSDAYTPASTDECASGKASCLNKTLKELGKIHDLNGQSCSHNAIFSLAYLRMTQYYGYTRDIPGYYQDVPFANFQDAVFAKYYTDAFWNWKNNNRAAVPQAWLYAFDAAKNKTTTGNGDLLLGMSAHINRDLPYVIASVGTVGPDGQTRKLDFDKVEEWLYAATEPMLAEAAARYDQTLDDTNDPLGLGYAATFQMVTLWRENAWRNAEALLAAPNAAARQLVVNRIENDANTIAQGLLATQSYGLLSNTTARDAWCAGHKGDAAPVAYEYGAVTPWGY